MIEMKLMIVEDAESDLEVCRSSIEIFKNRKKDKGIDLIITLVECKTVDDALKIIDGSFDGAIIDLRFSDNYNKGKDVLQKINDSLFRIPVVILTGTPDSINEEDRSSLINVLKKGEADYQEDILNVFFEIYNTGLTQIVGGRGKIEQTLNKVFLKNLLPQLEVWKDYGKSNPLGTEKALLRFTLNHLMHLLDDDEEKSFPEEVYIYPPLSDSLKTGSIIKKKEAEDLYVILNPACDLVIRSNNQFKTDRIMLVQIENIKSIIDAALDGITNKQKKENKLKDLFANNYTNYFHWLPYTKFFSGGFLNFRKVSTITKEELESNYDQPQIQISLHFVKDILSRFSSYYARQGQPDIEYSKVIEEIITSSGD